MKPQQLDLREEPARADHTAALEQLSASIAHEVSQPLSAALINAQIALRRLEADPPNLEEVRRGLDRVVRDINRVSAVVSGIRALVKKTPPERESVAINEAVLDVVASTADDARSGGVLVLTSLASGLPPVEGSRTQLQQVIRNLAINAIEAMGEMPEGSRVMMISTETAESLGVTVKVRDSGSGLPLKCRERIFEPFFTTKRSGMGLGLPISRSIVEAHGGRLWVEANRPSGAVFQFTLSSRPTAGRLGARCGKFVRSLSVNSNAVARQ